MKALAAEWVTKAEGDYSRSFRDAARQALGL
jgi:hypothetical protein